MTYTEVKPLLGFMSLRALVDVFNELQCLVPGKDAYPADIRRRILNAHELNDTSVVLLRDYVRTAIRKRVDNLLDQANDPDKKPVPSEVKEIAGIPVDDEAFNDYVEESSKGCAYEGCTNPPSDTGYCADHRGFSKRRSSFP